MEMLQNELYFKTAESDLELQSCYRLRFQVYCKEKRWLPSENFPDGLEIDEYDDKAIHVIALDEDFRVVGLMRILREKDYGKLPYIDHPGMKGKRLNLPNLAEISRFVINSTKYKHYLLKGLMRAVYQVSCDLGLKHWIFVAEPSLLRFLERYKFYCNPVCTPTKYYGGFTLVALCDVGNHEALWRRRDKKALEFNTAESTILQTHAMTV